MYHTYVHITMKVDYTYRVACSVAAVACSVAAYTLKHPPTYVYIIIMVDYTYRYVYIEYIYMSAFFLHFFFVFPVSFPGAVAVDCGAGPGLTYIYA